MKLIGAGVALRLRAVQVIQYVEGGTGSADRFGFDEEEGFVQEAPKAEPTFEEPVVDKIEEPIVRKSAEALDNSSDISGIIDKWGTKD